MAQSTSNFDFVFAELLPQILARSTTSDLLGHRLVNQEWRNVATKILLQRDLKIRFTLTSQPPFEEHPVYYSFKSGDQPGELPRDRTLSSFYRLISNPDAVSTLPANHFGFNFGDLQECDKILPQLVSFFQVYGPKIRALTLENNPNYFIGHSLTEPESSSVINPILKYTPNLESLNIQESFHENYFPWFTDSFTAPQNCGFNLPDLKFIKINRMMADPIFVRLDFRILRHLLTVAPNLQQISFEPDFDPQSLVYFPPSKIHLLNTKNIDTLMLSDKVLFPEYPQGSSSSLESLENCVTAMSHNYGEMGIKGLRIPIKAWPLTPYSWRRGNAIIYRIFEANANSLEEIKLQGGAGVILNKIKGLPALQKVKKLKVELSMLSSLNPDDILDFARSDNEDGHLVENSLSRLFPNLEELDLISWKLREDEQANLEKWFPFWNNNSDDNDDTKKLMKVKSLKAISHCLGEALKKSLKLCPKINSFSTIWEFSPSFTQMPERLFQPLINLAQLTSLHLQFLKPRAPILEDSFLDLDTALTGFSKETVIAIYNNWRQFGRWEIPGGCTTERAEWSLLSLKNLRKVHFEVSISFTQSPTTLLSGVSAKFGFDLMGDLEVLLVFDFPEKMLCFDPDDYNPEGRQKEEEWLELHRPLSSCSKVTVNCLREGI